MVLAADPRELSGILRCCENVVRIPWPVDCCYGAELSGRRVVLAANGPGERLATEALDVALERENLRAVVSTGYCGGLNPVLKPGEVFVAGKVMSMARGHLLDCRLPRTQRFYRAGTLFTGDRVIRTASERMEWNRLGGDAVDMESAAIGERAAGLGLEFFSIRAVTDPADEDLRLDFNAARGPDGRFRTRKILADALRRPWPCLPELWKLRGRANLASRRLGEFFAGCEF